MAFFVYYFRLIGLLAAMAADPHFVAGRISAELQMLGVNHCRPFVARIVSVDLSRSS